MSRPALAASALAFGPVILACGARPAQEGRGESAADTSSETERAVAVTDTVQAGGRRLELLEDGAGCVVRFDGVARGKLVLVPEPPCYFARRAGRPQTFSYPDIGVQSALVVLGSAARPEVRRRWNLPVTAVCGEETQAVLLIGERVVVTRAVNRGGVTCRDTGADEKVFWAFAHDELRGPNR